MSQRSRIQRHYEPRVHPERESFDILDWASQDAQHARFAVLARLLRKLAGQPLAGNPPAKSPPPLRLLDAGCGLADLRAYLRQDGFSVDPGPAAPHPEPGVRQPAFPVPLAYTGVDITPAILAEARRRQPDAQLLLADLFTEEPFPPQSVDVVFASGLFNLNLGNNAEFIRSGVPRLFGLASRLLAVNFLHERTPHKYGHCHYTHPDDLLREFGPLAARADVIADYLPNDFTLVLWR
jgi:hypothetical protein